jgi:excisionase family DNA binding protein
MTLDKGQYAYTSGMTTPPHDTLLTPRQVAEVLHLRTARPIYKLIHRGALPAARIGGRLLIDAGDVNVLLTQSRTPSQPTLGLRTLDRYSA